MKVNWLALLFWLAVAVAGTAALTYTIWHHASPVEQVSLPAQTVTVQPPPVVVPLPTPKPSYRPVTSAKRSATPAYKKPVYAPAYKKVPGGPVVDCKQVPAIAKTIPWAEVEAAAQQRNLTKLQIAELKTCMAR